MTQLHPHPSSVPGEAQPLVIVVLAGRGPGKAQSPAAVLWGTSVQDLLCFVHALQHKLGLLHPCSGLDGLWQQPCCGGRFLLPLYK